MDDVKAFLAEQASALGFCAVGVAGVQPFERHEAMALSRLERGLMGGLPWYTEARVRRGCRPLGLLPSARSIISVAMPYPDDLEGPHRGLGGWVSRYAWGPDYHGLMKDGLQALVTALGKQLGRKVASRIYVDDGPVLDRAVAERSGVGWFGKSTNIIVPGHGSWVFLGEAIVDVEMEPDEPLSKSCGGCTRCLEVCPTGALIAPHVLDNTRCISYLTIENRGPIPRHLRLLVGSRLFGCDVCQEACPVNRAAGQALPSNQQVSAIGELNAILEMRPEGFRERFRGSAIKRATLVGLQRNACVVLGNSGDRDVVPVLTKALDETGPLVRAHAAWALGRLGGRNARASLERALQGEGDAAVWDEVRLALEECA